MEGANLNIFFRISQKMLSFQFKNVRFFYLVVMYKSIGLCFFLILGSVHSNGQNFGVFEVKLSYINQSINLADTIKQLKMPQSIAKVDSLTFSKIEPVHLFKTLPNAYRPKKRLPVFCEIEHQLSRLIKRRVKLGVP